MYGAGDRVRGLEVAHFACLTLEVVAELWMGNGDELAGALADAAAVQLGYAVLGYHLVDDVFEGRDR